MLRTVALLGLASGAPPLPSKRGVGGAASLTQAGDLAALAGVAWFYDWSLEPRATSTALLGFNEPNLRSQANLTAAEACAAWPTLTAFAAASGLRLGSPAVDYCTPSGSGQQDSNCWRGHYDWLDEFFGNCSLDAVDFIATHKYGCNATATLEYVTQLSAAYGKPVWLTEFSCSEAAASSQLAFQQQLLP